mgnify:CR=1 FL=1
MGASNRHHTFVMKTRGLADFHKKVAFFPKIWNDLHQVEKVAKKVL